ncbi:hypothetical protein BC827DRAFT_28913 [Russula dissimulans]|nr:hypothetical protein BC827DRAFT_28913 [Russula dissimulans]
MRPAHNGADYINSPCKSEVGNELATLTERILEGKTRPRNRHLPLSLPPTSENMSQTSTTGPHGWSYCPRAVWPPTSSFASMHISQPLPTWTLGDSFPEFPTVPQRGKALDQHPGFVFLGMPSSVRPSTHVQSHQFGVGLVHADPRIGAGFPNRQKPTNSHVPRFNHPLVYPPRRGEPHAFLYRRSAPVTYRPEVAYPIPVDLHAAQTSHQRILGRHSPTTPSCQPNLQAAAPSQRPPPHKDPPTCPSPTTHAPQPTPLVFVEDPLSIAASFKCEGTGAKETMSATESCPFPTCSKKCGRLQELERHIRKHLPRCIFCRQPDCSWTGTRRRNS